MDEGIRDFPAELDARESELEREAMYQTLADIAVPGGTVIVPSASEHWGFSLLGWLCMAGLVACVVLLLVAIQ